MKNLLPRIVSLLLAASLLVDPALASCRPMPFQYGGIDVERTCRYAQQALSAGGLAWPRKVRRMIGSLRDAETWSGMFRIVSGRRQRPPAISNQNFPSPISVASHPWNLRFHGPGSNSFSYLDRHDLQVDEFKTDVLPTLVEQQMPVRQLKISVVGPATGEEMVTLLAAVIEAFEANSSWGDLETWDIQMDGIEIHPQIAQECIERLAGRPPFVLNDGVLLIRGAREAQRVERLVAALNRHPAWVRRAATVGLGDIRQRETMASLKEAHVVFMNAGAEVSQEIADGFSAYCKNAAIFLSFTEAQFRDHTLLQRSGYMPRMSMPYAVAVPKRIDARPRPTIRAVPGRGLRALFAQARRLLKMISLGLISIVVAFAASAARSRKASDLSLFTHPSTVGTVIVAVVVFLIVFWALPAGTSRTLSRLRSIPRQTNIPRVMDDGGILEPFPTALDVSELWNELFKRLRIELPDPASPEARRIATEAVDFHIRGHSILWIYAFRQLFKNTLPPASGSAQGNEEVYRYRVWLEEVLDVRVEDQAARDYLDASYPASLQELYQAAEHLRHEVEMQMVAQARPLVMWWISGASMRLYVRIFSRHNPAIEEKFRQITRREDLFPWTVYQGVVEEEEGYLASFYRPVSIPKIGKIDAPRNKLVSWLPAGVPWGWLATLALLLAPVPWPVNALTRVGMWATVWATVKLVGLIDARPFRETPVWLTTHPGTTVKEMLSLSGRAHQHLIYPPWQQRDMMKRLDLLSPAWIQSLLMGILLGPAIITLLLGAMSHLLTGPIQTKLFYLVMAIMVPYVIGGFLTLGPWGWLLSVQPSYQSRHPEFGKLLNIAAAVRVVAMAMLFAAPLLALITFLMGLMYISKTPWPGHVTSWLGSSATSLAFAALAAFQPGTLRPLPGLFQKDA